jgi:hypothetical protein
MNKRKSVQDIKQTSESRFPGLDRNDNGCFAYAPFFLFCCLKPNTFHLPLEFVKLGNNVP